MRPTTEFEAACAAVHLVARDLPRRDHRERKRLPAGGGIYLFFEKGETVVLNGKTIPRIVRVGQTVKFPKRMREHYGHVKSFRGNKDKSILRKHVGGALLKRTKRTAASVREWERKGTKFPKVEVLVSKTLRERFTFVCFSVPTKKERDELEKWLIALIANHRLGRPSRGWLGRDAANPKIPESGLWNDDYVKAVPFASAEFELFKVRATDGMLDPGSYRAKFRKISVKLAPVRKPRLTRPAKQR